MITPEQKKELKEFLGNEYVSKVRKRMDEKKVRKSGGGEYSDAAIKAVLNQGKENIDIEECIYEVAAEIKTQQNNIAELRKKMLSGHTTAKITPQEEEPGEDQENPHDHNSHQNQ